MNRQHQTCCCVLTSLLFVSHLVAQEIRNPFGVNDVTDPFNDTSLALLNQMELTGNKNDPNAKNWTTKAVEGNPMFLDGDWFGRWNNPGSKTWSSSETQIKVIEDHLYILYREPKSKSGYLIEARRVGDKKLVGAYVSIGTSGSASPWAGIIVDGERIDGIWSTDGARWDFRRRTVRKLPKSDRPK